GGKLIEEAGVRGGVAATGETLVTLPQDPTFYLANPAQFTADIAANSSFTPAGDGSFSQNVQRLGLYAEDSWRVLPELTVTYGIRYDTTFCPFDAAGPGPARKPFPPALHPPPS